MLPHKNEMCTNSQNALVTYLQSVVQMHHHFLYSHHQSSLPLPDQTKTTIKLLHKVLIQRLVQQHYFL